jgi:O-antigen/teichoic acid export membrane protein
VLAGWGLTWIIAGLALTRWVGAVIFYAIYARTAPAAEGRPGFDEVRDLIRFGGWVGLSNSIIPLTFYLERLVITALRGPAALAYYAAPHELIWKLHLIPSAIGGVLFPAFSGLSSGGQRHELVRRIGQGVRLITLLIAPATALLIVVARPLLTLWLGADYGDASTAVLQLLAVAVFLNAIAFIPFVLIEGVGRPATIAQYHLLELPLYAALLWWLVTQYGIVGGAAAAAVRMLVMVFALSYAALRHAGLTLAESLPGASRRLLAAGAALLGVALLAASVLRDPFAQLAAGTLLVGAFAAGAWPWLLEAEDRAALLSMVGALRRRAPSGRP